MPVLSALIVTGLTLGWIVVGTEWGEPWVTSQTRFFIRDGMVRWPAAAIALAALLRVRRRWPVRVLGRPQRPHGVPWGTAAMVIGCLIILSPVSQFWNDGGYTAAVFFSEMSTGVFEELVFRGVILCGLLYGLGRSERSVRIALVLTSVLFGVVHVLGGPISIVVTMLVGAVFMRSTLELSSLWPAAIFHGLLDVGANGADAAPQGDFSAWGEPWIISGDLLLLVAGIVAFVSFFRWKSWPVEDGFG